MRTTTFFRFVSLGSACLAGTASLVSAGAQETTPEVVLVEGDHVLNLGDVRTISDPLANDAGTWFAEVSTNNGDSNRDGGILRSGFLNLREGTFVPEPPGATIRAFNDVSVNVHGRFGWTLRLRDTEGGNDDDEGLFWNTLMLAQEGAPVGAPEVSSETVHGAFKVAKINDRDSLLVSCDIVDPEGEIGVQDALLLYRTDGAGQVTDYGVLLQEGEELLRGTTVRVVSANTHSLALNNRDDWACQVRLNGPVEEADTALVVNGDVVLREGDASFQEGRVWANLLGTPVDLNDFGDYVVRTSLNAEEDSPQENDDAVILLNGEKFLQEGDSFPAIAPFTLQRFDPAPVFVTNSGDVFWYGQTSRPEAGSNQAFYRNTEVIVQEGESIDGNTISAIRTGTSAFHVSPGGRFWIGEVGLQNVGETLLLEDFGLVEPVHGCVGNAGSLAKSGGAAVVGRRVSFGMDHGQAGGVTPFVYFSTRAAIVGDACGIDTSLGEVLIGLGGPRIVGRRFGTPWNGFTPTQVHVDLPADTSLVDVEFHAQGLFWDIAGTTGAERFRLTNGLRLVIGAP